MTKKLYFTKMHWTGNDFILIDNTSWEYNGYIDSSMITKLCSRHTGVWADWCIEIQKWNLTDFKYIMYHQDWSQWWICGNWTRCFFRYLIDKHWIDPMHPHDIETNEGIITLQTDGKSNIIVMMWSAEFVHEGYLDLPGNKNYHYNVINIAGYPHCVIFLNTKEEREKISLEQYGELIENMIEIFPQKTNVEFARFDGDEFYCKIRERNFWITRACGKWSCATVIVGRKLGLTNHTRNIINLWGGKLTINRSWNRDDPIYLTGNTDYVFQWEINL